MMDYANHHPQRRSTLEFPFNANLLVVLHSMNAPIDDEPFADPRAHPTHHRLRGRARRPQAACNEQGTL